MGLGRQNVRWQDKTRGRRATEPGNRRRLAGPGPAALGPSFGSACGRPPARACGGRFGRAGPSAPAGAP